MQRVDHGMGDRNTDAGRWAVQDDEVERPAQVVVAAAREEFDSWR
jgi:hypothetical protein